MVLRQILATLVVASLVITGCGKSATTQTTSRRQGLPSAVTPADPVAVEPTVTRPEVRTAHDDRLDFTLPLPIRLPGLWSDRP